MFSKPEMQCFNTQLQCSFKNHFYCYTWFEANPLRLSGTKVVMTPRGFVQVRSDKGKTQIVTTKMVNGNQGDVNNEKVQFVLI